MNWETLLCIGDSITYGARSYAGYPEYAGAKLEDVLSKHWNVINLAVSRLKTIEISRLVSDNFTNLKNQSPSIITIMAGTNDIRDGISTSDYVLALTQLAIKAQIICNNVVLLKIPYFTKGVMYPYDFKMNDQVKFFNDQIEIVAHKLGIRYYEFVYNPDCFFDGVHLNDVGSQSFGIQLAKFILKDKGVELHEE